MRLRPEMDDGAQFVVAAYAVIWVGLLLYIMSIGLKLARMAREIELIGRLVGEDVVPDETPTLTVIPARRPTPCPRSGHPATLGSGPCRPGAPSPMIPSTWPCHCWSISAAGGVLSSAVVRSGPVARRGCGEHGAEVVVISPQITPGIAAPSRAWRRGGDPPARVCQWRPRRLPDCCGGDIRANGERPGGPRRTGGRGVVQRGRRPVGRGCDRARVRVARSPHHGRGHRGRQSRSPPESPGTGRLPRSVPAGRSPSTCSPNSALSWRRPIPTHPSCAAPLNVCSTPRPSPPSPRPTTMQTSRAPPWA